MSLRVYFVLIARWLRRLPLLIASLFLSGCATTPPYHAGIRVLPAAQLVVTKTPAVRIRIATPAERNLITDFPGKKALERSAQWDMTGAILISPALILVCWPDIICDVFSDPHGGHEQRLQTQAAMAQFQCCLTQAIGERLRTAPPAESRDLLELVYVAEIRTIGPAADRTSFIFHGRLTFQSQGTVVYQDLLRIDPRGFSDDVPSPECTQDAGTILRYAKEVIPGMIQTRLPGLPWQPNPRSDTP